MGVNDDAVLLNQRFVLDTFASKLVPAVRHDPLIGGFFVPGFQAKKSQRLSWLGLS
jgi:hypothetical protein